MSEQEYDWKALLSAAGITPPSDPTSLRDALAAVAAQAGGGGGGAWGQSSTAKFSGSGSPSGVVTPSGEGDLYVDDTTPGLWQATGTGDTDWQQIGTSVQANWCEVAVANAPTLDVATSSYQFLEADLSIVAQSGTDFSVGDAGGAGAILSAQGGWFAASLYFGTPSGVTLDGGSTKPRYMSLAMILGDSTGDNPLSSDGYDAFVPATDDAAVAGGDMATTAASTPGHTTPGGPALAQVLVAFVNPTGSDSITAPMGGSGNIIIWQFTQV